MRDTWVRSLGWEDPLEKGKATTPVLRPGDFPGLYSPWGRKGSDTTERLSSARAPMLVGPELPCSPRDALPSPGPCPPLSPSGFPGTDSQERWRGADSPGLRTTLFPCPSPTEGHRTDIQRTLWPQPAQRYTLRHTVSPRQDSHLSSVIYTPQLPKKAKQDQQKKLLPSTRQAIP